MTHIRFTNNNVRLLGSTVAHLKTAYQQPNHDHESNHELFTAPSYETML